MSNRLLQVDILFKSLFDGKGAKQAQAAIDGTGKAAGQAEPKMTAFKAAGIAAGAALTALATAQQLFQAGMQGAALEKQAQVFERLAESMGTTADVMLGKLREATRGMMSDAMLMESASSIISLGLGKTEDDVIRLATVIGGLGLDMQQVILTFANDSTMRLDALGLSVESVTARVDELKAQNFEGDAFDQAVLLELEDRYSMLADGVGDSDKEFKTFIANLQNAKNEMLKNVAEGITPLIAGVNDLTEAVRDHNAEERDAIQIRLLRAESVDRLRAANDALAFQEAAATSVQQLLNAGYIDGAQAIDQITHALRIGNITYAEAITLLRQVEQGNADAARAGIEQATAVREQIQAAARVTTLSTYAKEAIDLYGDAARRAAETTTATAIPAAVSYADTLEGLGKTAWATAQQLIGLAALTGTAADVNRALNAAGSANNELAEKRARQVAQQSEDWQSWAQMQQRYQAALQFAERANARFTTSTDRATGGIGRQAEAIDDSNDSILRMAELFDEIDQVNADAATMIAEVWEEASGRISDAQADLLRAQEAFNEDFARAIDDFNRTQSQGLLRWADEVEKNGVPSQDALLRRFLEMKAAAGDTSQSIVDIATALGLSNAEAIGTAARLLEIENAMRAIAESDLGIDDEQAALEALQQQVESGEAIDLSAWGVNIQDANEYAISATQERADRLKEIEAETQAEIERINRETSARVLDIQTAQAEEINRLQQTIQTEAESMGDAFVTEFGRSEISAFNLRGMIQGLADDIALLPRSVAIDFSATGNAAPGAGNRPTAPVGTPGGDATYWTGGYTGSGNWREIAGVVHRDELVIPSAVRRAGPDAAADFIARNDPLLGGNAQQGARQNVVINVTDSKQAAIVAHAFTRQQRDARWGRI